RKKTILTNMASLSTNSIMMSLLLTVSTVLGCGVMPAGQGGAQKIVSIVEIIHFRLLLSKLRNLVAAGNKTFSVTGLTLPVSMVYTSQANAIRFSGIATSEAGARGFVQRLVMQTVRLQVFDIEIFSTEIRKGVKSSSIFVSTSDS
ncbi:hypothetical protein KIN20_012855, partial [Parelaphostrongylus tenuis]